MSSLIVIVTVASLIFYIATLVGVGLARKACAVPPPAMTGPPRLERALRVQGNTVEGMVLYLPSLWMFSLYYDPRIAAGLGAAWIVGRIAFMVGYMKDPKLRAPGYGLQLLATMALMFGALFAAARQFLGAA